MKVLKITDTKLKDRWSSGLRLRSWTEGQQAPRECRQADKLRRGRRSRQPVFIERPSFMKTYVIWTGGRVV